jgi:hypothetical protein
MMHMPGKIGKRGLQPGQNLGRGAGLSSSLLIVEYLIRWDQPPQLVLSGNGVGFNLKWSTLEKAHKNNMQNMHKNYAKNAKNMQVSTKAF